MERRLQVLDRSDPIELDDVITSYSLKEAAENFTKLSAKYENECKQQNRTTKIVNNYYGYDNGYESYIEVWREENDEEFLARIRQEEHIKMNKKIAEQKKKDKARAILLATETEERELLAQLQEKYK